jgi:hypothetical protein
LGVTSGARIDEVGAGDSVVLEAPGGTEYLTVLDDPGQGWDPFSLKKLGGRCKSLVLVLVVVAQGNGRGHSNAALLGTSKQGSGRGGAYLACGLPLTAITVPKTAKNQKAGTKLPAPK